MAKGISLIQGNKYPKIGEPTTYTVAGFYPGTVPPQDESAIKWKIYAEQSTGNWRELRGSERQGRQATFSFPQQWYGKKILVEAYLHNPEKKTPPGLIIMPVPGERKIDSIGFFDSNWNPLQQTPKYGQTLNVRINTINMLGEDLKISLWERDTYSDTGHDPTENTNVWDNEKTYKVTDPNGRVEFSMPLDLMWRLKADKGIFDIEGSEHEYYLLVKGAGARTKYSRQQNVRDEVDTSASATPRTAPTPAPATNRPASSTPAQGGNPGRPAPNNAPANSPVSPPANVSQQQPVTVSGVGANLPATGGGVSPAVVNDVNVEGLIDAYFAKKEYTKKTTDSAGNFEYNVGSNGNKTATDAEKTNIATAIFGKQNVKDLVKEKRYTTLEAIKAGLTKAVYNRNDKVTFETFKLEAEFVKVNSAPLETKLYLVAKAYVLDDKQATIIIKEKDGLIKGAPDSVLPILEITEAEMEQATPTTGEVPGTEKSEFTGTIKDGLVKIPVHLRPKSDDDLKTWKDKLTKGIEDGKYEYEFGNPNNIVDEAKRKSTAEIILNNVKKGNTRNTKIEAGKTAYLADIEASLELINYVAGAKISFPIFKKQPELLYLNVKATGEKEHNKDFLKAEGAYFQIGKKCICEERIRAFMRVIRIAEGTGEYVKGTKTPRDPQLGYTTWFSGAGNNFTLSDDHPRVINSNSTNTLRSSAAGAYQFMSWKFDELNGKTVIFKNGYFQTAVPEIYTEASDKAKKYDAKGFEEIAQDRLCVIILKDIGTITKLLNDDIRGAISTSSGTWVSLPGATAGQPTAKMQETLDYYEEFLKEELAGNSHLHIQKGFLKDFDITCTCGNESTGSWRHPLDRMELRGWYGSGFYPGDSDHGDAEVRFSKHHEGLDLYAPVGTEVYACVDGEIYEDYISGTYGNTLGIKGTYNGETYYFFYAHLSERSVAKGDKVTAGDSIGKTGQSGNASGQAAKMDHLHFEVRTTSARTGGRIDPIATIDELKNDVVTNPDQTTQTGN